MGSGALWSAFALALAAWAAPSAAYLALHPDNPRYFQETTTGRSVLIASHGNLAPTSRGIDYVAEIARNAGHGMPYARVWHWLPWEGADALWPWQRQGPLGEGGLWDLDTWDPEYWRRLRDGIARCADLGIYVEVMLFDACGMKAGPDRWRNNPWAADNNVNGIELPGRDTRGIPGFYDAESRPNLREYQTRYMARLIDETIGYPNVIYEIENEHVGGVEPEWTLRVGAFVKQYLASRHPESPRLVANSSVPQVCFDAPTVDIVNLHSDSADPDFYNRLLEGYWPLGKAMNVDELANGFTDYDALRRVCWTIVASGGHFHIEDADAASRPYLVARNVLGFLRASRWRFSRAAPDRRVVTTGDGYCMAAPGTEYMCYFPQGGDKRIALAPARYRGRWWDPRLGGFQRPFIVVHRGGEAALRTPDPNDWVLYLQRIAVAG